MSLAIVCERMETMESNSHLINCVDRMQKKFNYFRFSFDFPIGWRMEIRWCKEQLLAQEIYSILIVILNRNYLYAASAGQKTAKQM